MLFAKKILKIKNILLFCLILIFGIKINIFLDPDFGWRFRNGLLIISSGIPKTDPYSYTMRSFPWVDHSWLTDVVIFNGYNLIGSFGLAVFFSTLTVAALIISASRAQNTNNWITFNRSSKLDLGYFYSPVFVLSVAIFIPFLAVRAQVITWLMFSIFLRFVFDEKLWNRFKLFIPLLFLLWANLHGGFALGIFILYVLFILRFLKSFKINYQELFVVVASTLATFINPYFITLYQEVWSTVGTNNLRGEIGEWLPAFMSFDIPTLSLVTLFLIFIFKYRNKFKLEETVISLLLLFWGIASVRNIPLWVLSAAPLIARSLGYFYNDIVNIGKSKFKNVRIERFKKIYTYLWIYTLLALIFTTYFSFRNARLLSETNFYPRSAVNFLKNHNAKGEIFSDYNWGGYLIWKYPEKKVFIDGRMVTWKWQANIPAESNYIMGEYIDFINGTRDFDDEFKKYNIHTVLWPNRQAISLINTFEIYIRSLVSDERVKNVFDVHKYMVDKGWKLIYKDNVASIYQK